MSLELDGSSVGNSTNDEVVTGYKTVGITGNGLSLTVNILAHAEYIKKLEQIAHLVGIIHHAGNFVVETHNEAKLDELLSQVGAKKTSAEEREHAEELYDLNSIEYTWRGERKVWS